MRKGTFANKTEDLCTPVARAIQREQEIRDIDTERLAELSGVRSRTIRRIKAGGSTNIHTLDKILDVLGLELTAQPIGADYREQMKNI